MLRWIAVGLAVALGSGSVAQAQSKAPVVIWTAVGAGAGFGVGVWAGLSAFDDAINSDRKVWTSAIVGACAGGVAGYLIGRAQRRQPSPATGFVSPSRRLAADAQLLEQVAKSFRFGRTAIDRPAGERGESRRGSRRRAADDPHRSSSRSGIRSPAGGSRQ